MAVIIVFALIFLTLNNYAQAGRYSKCEIVGIKDSEWGSTYTMKVRINDTFRGEIAAFQTRNVLRVKFAEQKYLNASWENQVLRFFTADNFDDYEKNTDLTTDPFISIQLNFDCIEDGGEKMTFKQQLLDANNYDPVLNQKSYDYRFGMTIPKGFKLTELLPIYSTDFDVTNDKVFFTFDGNENFTINSEGRRSFKKFSTELTVLNEISAPFSQKFTLTATDYGHPERTSTASLSINVYNPEKLDDEETEKAISHPPVFGKHLYFADYKSNHELKLEEPIVMKYGAQKTTILKQTGYLEYFTVRFEASTYEKIVVDVSSPLAEDILKQLDFITIEIEAINPDIQHMPGRTALLIRLPEYHRDESNNSGGNKDCENTVVLGYSLNGYVVPMILFLLAVFSIVFINIYVIIMFVNKHKIRASNA